MRSRLHHISGNEQRSGRETHERKNALDSGVHDALGDNECSGGWRNDGEVVSRKCTRAFIHVGDKGIVSRNVFHANGRCGIDEGKYTGVVRCGSCGSRNGKQTHQQTVAGCKRLCYYLAARKRSDCNYSSHQKITKHAKSNWELQMDDLWA